MVAYHLVARTRGRIPLLSNFEFAHRVWRGLRRGFSNALAATLMLDHVHLIADGEDPVWMRRRLARALAGSAWGRGRGTWDPVPEPDLIREPKLARAVRYVALNPCRRGLAGDPFEWLWSTYRDLFGAVASPWTGPERIARRLGWGLDGFDQRFHQFVSSDHTVAIDGTPLPSPATTQLLPHQSLDALVLAAGSSLRVVPSGLRSKGTLRKVFVALAKDQGWRDPEVLADCCQITPRAVRYLLRDCGGTPIAPALVCLGDGRLTVAMESMASRSNLSARSLVSTPNHALSSTARKIATPRLPVPAGSSPWWKIGRRWLGLG